MVPPAAGFDASQVSPQDAAVTVRSLRRRFAEAFDRAESPDQLTAPGRDGLSAVDHVAATASELEQIRSALGQTVLNDRPRIQLPGGAAGVSGASTPAAALARLGDAADQLARAMGDVHGDAWLRAAESQNGEISALDMVRLAVHLGVDHLHAVERCVNRGGN